VQFGSRDQVFPRKFYIMGYNFKKCQKWKERIEKQKWPNGIKKNLRGFVWKMLLESKMSPF